MKTLCLFVCLLLLPGIGALAQPAIALDLYSSGNGHGLFLSPSLIFHSGFNSFQAGAVVQQHSRQLQGARFVYSRSLTGGSSSQQGYNYYLVPRKDLLEFGVHGFAQYVHNSLLCRSVVRDEVKVAYNREVDYAKLRLSTAEAGAGCWLQVNLSNHLSWKSSAGISVFHHLSYVRGMDHERTLAVLNLGTSFIYNLRP